MDEEKIKLKTKDNVEISASYYENKQADEAIILIHQFRRDKKSYDSWIERLQQKRTILAIDLRGHGESQGDLEEFDEKDFISMTKDLDAAFSYLRRKGFESKNIHVIGASIGANTVHNYALHNFTGKQVLLSPGLEFKGIEFEMQDGEGLIIVSKDDEKSIDSVRQIQERLGMQTIYLEGKEHGTDMLSLDIIEKILSYLDS